MCHESKHIAFISIFVLVTSSKEYLASTTIYPIFIPLFNRKHASTSFNICGYITVDCLENFYIYLPVIPILFFVLIHIFLSCRVNPATTVITFTVFHSYCVAFYFLFPMLYKLSQNGLHRVIAVKQLRESLK